MKTTLNVRSPERSYPFRPILNEFDTLFTRYARKVLDCEK